MWFDGLQLLPVGGKISVEHAGRARIAPSGARVHVGAHGSTELGPRPAHGTEVLGQ
jgi:hypothetical protein